MRICFYTAEQPSVSSMLNMHYLIKHRPDHHYSFLKIKSAPSSPAGLMERLKKIYAQVRFNDGRFDFGKDLITLDKRLQKEIPRINPLQFKTGFADAVNDEASEQFLADIKPDIIVQAGAGILKENIFNKA